MDLGKKRIFKGIIWFSEGIIVGLGAILPGISGGTLCVVFGMYPPLIAVISHPKENIIKYGKMLAVFLSGAAFGFIGLSGAASRLMSLNSDIASCAFIGLIAGTFPELWRSAGAQGRTKISVIALFFGFTAMLAVLLGFKTLGGVSVNPDFFGFILCGVLWGLSFIVPGLSSSLLLMFFGLYLPMLKGIADIDMTVIFPISLGAAACIAALTHIINAVYKKHFNFISHCITGITAAAAVMLFPFGSASGSSLIYFALCIVCGAALSFTLTRICTKLKQ